MKTLGKIEYLDQRAKEAPEYREVLSVFKEIFVSIDGRENETGISFMPSRRHDAERISGGFPLIDREDMRIEPHMATRFLVEMIDVIDAVGRDGAEGLAAMKTALLKGRCDLPVLFGACFTRARPPLEEAALATGVPSPLLEFILDTTLKTALESYAETVEPEGMGKWREPYCPVCGGRPGMAELAGEEGKRYLSCSACFFKWPFTRIKCPYCGTDDQESLSYFEVGVEATRVDVCRKCSRYIKTRDSRKGNSQVPLEAEDLVTLHLDLLAVREGYERGK